MSKIEITALTNDVQADIQQIQQDIDAEGYDITVGTNQHREIVLTGNKTDLQDLICEETFRECYLAGVSITTAKDLIHDGDGTIINNRDLVAEAKFIIRETRAGR